MDTLKLGSRGTDVITLQKKLNLHQDGIFGPLTEEAVKEFQKNNGLTADGIVGTKTWAKLGIASNNRNIKEIRKSKANTSYKKGYRIKKY